MLEEAVDVIASLFTGAQVTHHGKHAPVETARRYSRPQEPPPIDVSGVGEESARLAGRIGDGYISMSPEADLVKVFRDEGGGARPVQGGLKTCWAPDVARARATMRRRWPTDFIPGEAAQLLPLPRHFRQLAPLVTDAMRAAPPVSRLPASTAPPVSRLPAMRRWRPMRAIIGDEIRVPILWCEFGSCIARYTSREMIGERDLRARALAGGWRYDAVGRLACPSCVRHDPSFRVGRVPAPASQYPRRR